MCYKIRICFSLKKELRNVVQFFFLYLVFLQAYSGPKEKSSGVFLIDYQKIPSQKEISLLGKKVDKGEIAGVILIPSKEADFSELLESFLPFRSESFSIGVDCSNGFPEEIHMANSEGLAPYGSISDPELLVQLAYENGLRLKGMGVDYVIVPSMEIHLEGINWGSYLGQNPEDAFIASRALNEGLLKSGIPSIQPAGNNFWDQWASKPDEKQPGLFFRRNPTDEKALDKARSWQGIKISPLVPSRPKLTSAFVTSSFSGYDLIRVDGPKSSSIRFFQKSWKKERSSIESQNKIERLDEFKKLTQRNDSSPDYDPKYSERSLKQKLESGSIVLLDRAGELPLNQDGFTKVVLAENSAFNSSSSLKKGLERHCPIVSYDLSNTETDLLSLDGSSFIVFNLIDKDSAYIRTADFKKLILDLSEERQRMVFCYQGLIPDFSARSVLFSPLEEKGVSLAMADILFGASQPTGRLNFELPGFNLGEGIFLGSLGTLGKGIPEDHAFSRMDLFPVDQVIEEALMDSATPGGQVMVIQGNQIIYQNAFGKPTYEEEKSVLSTDLYDVASLTKVLGTLQVIMWLNDQAVLSIDSPAIKYLPELEGSDKEDILVKDLLVHQAGLAPYIPFWSRIKRMEGKDDFFYCEFEDDWFCVPVADSLFTVSTIEDSLWIWTLESSRLEKNDEGEYTYRYSDLSFYLLKAIAERISNQPIEEFISQNFWDPMGVWRMRYNPLDYFEKEEIVPTELDAYFRNQQVHGTVHDQGAALLGGVGGHAGIFSDAREIGKILLMNRNNGTYAGETYFKKGTVEMFSKQARPGNRRGLGWDKPNPYGEGPSSELCSYRSYGHSGFTGTTAWVDPDYDLIYIFLSNRVYPSASNRKLIRNNIRTRIQDVIYESIFKNEMSNP